MCLLCCVDDFRHRGTRHQYMTRSQIGTMTVALLAGAGIGYAVTAVRGEVLPAPATGEDPAAATSEGHRCGPPSTLPPRPKGRPKLVVVPPVADLGPTLQQSDDDADLITDEYREKSFRGRAPVGVAWESIEPIEEKELVLGDEEDERFRLHLDRELPPELSPYGCVRKLGFRPEGLRVYEVEMILRVESLKGDGGGIVRIAGVEIGDSNYPDRALEDCIVNTMTNVELPTSPDLLMELEREGLPLAPSEARRYHLSYGWVVKFRN